MNAHTYTQAHTHIPLTSSMTGWWIFYMFIHFNLMAGVLLKCWCAAYISPLRQGRHRCGQGSLFLVSHCLSSIIICSSASVCLLPLSIHRASQPLWQMPSCTLMHLCNVIFSVTRTFDLYAYLYILYISLLSETPFALCLSLRSYLSRWAVSVPFCLFLPFFQVSHETQACSWTVFWVELSFGHGAMTETLESLSGQRQ